MCESLFVVYVVAKPGRHRQSDFERRRAQSSAACARDSAGVPIVRRRDTWVSWILTWNGIATELGVDLDCALDGTELELIVLVVESVDRLRVCVFYYELFIDIYFHLLLEFFYILRIRKYTLLLYASFFSYKNVTASARGIRRSATFNGPPGRI